MLTSWFSRFRFCQLDDIQNLLRNRNFFKVKTLFSLSNVEQIVCEKLISRKRIMSRLVSFIRLTFLLFQKKLFIFRMWMKSLEIELRIFFDSFYLLMLCFFSFFTCPPSNLLLILNSTHVIQWLKVHLTTEKKCSNQRKHITKEKSAIKIWIINLNSRRLIESFLILKSQHETIKEMQ